MSMSMSMTDVASSTMAPMSMATDMSSMDMGSSNTTMMRMENMAMTFFSSSTTPLFSMAWTPKSTKQYFGTCLFLIALAVIFRALLSIRLNLFNFLRTVRHERKEDPIYGYGVNQTSAIRPWKASEAVWIASMDILVAGIAYLLMVAVMTMNVGYFLAILGGIFLGSLIFAPYIAQSAAH